MRDYGWFFESCFYNLKGKRGICVLWGQLRWKVWQHVWSWWEGGRGVQILQSLENVRKSLGTGMKLEFCFCKSGLEENTGVQGDGGKQWQNKCSILKWALRAPPGCVWHWGVPEGAVLLLQVLSGGRVLALPSAQLSDTGTYVCVAVNAAGESQRDIDLRVYGECQMSFWFWQLFLKL